MPGLTGYQHISVDTRERTRCTSIQSNGIGCLNVEEHLDFVRGDEIDASYAEGVNVSERRH
jgi:hypothetical protein